MSPNTRGSAAMLAGILLLATASGPAPAQTDGYGDEGYLASPLLAVGYAANAPDQLVGFGAMTVGVPWPGWGAYVDGKLTSSSPRGEDNFTTERTAEEAESLGDSRFGSVDRTWTTVNVAVVRAVSPEVALYAGAGLSRETTYQEFEDTGGERGVLGFYTVEDERLGGDTANLLGGLFFRAGRRISFQLGGETAPAGFTVGAGLVFPLPR